MENAAAGIGIKTFRSAFVTELLHRNLFARNGLFRPGSEVDPGNRTKREGVKRPALSQRMEYGYDQITQEV
jgi:hypothetical protein